MTLVIRRLSQATPLPRHPDHPNDKDGRCGAGQKVL
jgi:hypothetical protein